MQLRIQPAADALHQDAATIKCLAAARLAGVALTTVNAKSKEEATPVLIAAEGGAVVARSNAIARFLCSKSGDSPMASALVDEWLNVASRKYATVALAAVADTLNLDLPETAAVDKAALSSTSLAELVSVLKPLDAHLASRTFLVGDRLSLADVGVAATLCQAFAAVMGPTARSSLRHTTRWMETVMRQPCFAAAGVFPDFEVCGSDVVALAASGAAMPLEPAMVAAADALFSRSRVRVKELLAQGRAAAGQQVRVCGWARTIRGSSAEKPVFIELNDGSSVGNLQIVCVSDALPAAHMQAVLQAGGIGSSFDIQGAVVESPAKGQPIEVRATSVTVLGRVPDPQVYPLAKTKVAHTVEYLRTIAHLRPRTQLISSVARVRHACAMATHAFFDQRGFLYVHTPILTAADCEGAGEMFQVTTLLAAATKTPPVIADKDERVLKGLAKAGDVDYKKDFFARPTFLTVSGQLNVECYATALSDVYTFGPTFRAENSNTTRHLAEFWMIEPEMCFATLKDDMDLAEDFVKYVTRHVMQHCAEDLAFFEERVESGLLQRLENVIEAPFVRLTYSEAMVILEEHHTSGKKTFSVEPKWGIDLGSEHERYLTEDVYKRPVILTNYPAGIKAFYMKRSESDPRTVEAMDVLVPRIGELIGGSARETDYALLDAKVKEHNLDVGWYMDLRRWGSVPHAGFGLGFERLILFVTGITNIREVIPFPRYPGNADF